MTKEEALVLDLALAALEEVAARTGARWALEQGYAGHLEAINAIKQARSAPVQELGARVDAVIAKIKAGIAEKPTALNSYGLKLWDSVRDDLLALATPPAPQRTWVGLTDEERDDLLDNYITAEGRARAIEAKLKEKNT
jgi:hypothetical protein